MSKYIIEINPEYEDKFRGVMILGAENSNLYVDSNTVDELEELNSDYINKNFGDLQDTAYKRGINDGSLDVKQRVEGAYQRGLNDAWEAAKKIADMWTRIGNTELLAIFGITERIGNSTIRSLFEKQTANEAMLNLEAYEEKQKADDEIKVGDEVEVLNSGNKYLIAWFAGTSLCGFAHDGVTCRLQPSDVRKTGRHFDIKGILEAMKHD